MRQKMPSHREIVNANLALIKELQIEHPIRTCWACRKEFFSSLPVRAHIEADKHGAISGDASNYLLLCNTDHSRQPDSAPRDYQMRWLKSNHLIRGETSQEIIAEMFESINGIPLNELLNKMIDRWGTQGMLDRFRVALKEGKKSKAGPQNGIANAVYELTLILESLKYTTNV